MKEVDKVISKYEEMFGGYPAYLLMGASDDEVVAALQPCIESGKEYEAPDEDAIY